MSNPAAGMVWSPYETFRSRCRSDGVNTITYTLSLLNLATSDSTIYRPSLKLFGLLGRTNALMTEILKLEYKGFWFYFKWPMLLPLIYEDINRGR
jgi:hypothetical protein